MKEIKLGDNIDRKIRAFWYPPDNRAYIVVNDEKYTLVNKTILESLDKDKVNNIFLNRDPNEK